MHNGCRTPDPVHAFPRNFGSSFHSSCSRSDRPRSLLTAGRVSRVGAFEYAELIALGIGEHYERFGPGLSDVDPRSIA